LNHRFWAEAIMATVSGALFLVTLLWHDWIEIVFRVDPDQHSGWLEWLIVAVALASTAIFSILAHAEWRRAPRAAPQSATR
jgi:hypothetical protein